MEHPIDRAAHIVGTQAAIARGLKVSKTAVSLWKAPGGRVPAEHCPLIEEMTLGAVRCEDLRPDIRWDVLRLKRRRALLPVPSGAAEVDAPSEQPGAAA